MIPSIDELFDETVSTWIEDDVEHLIEETDERWQEVASIDAYHEKHDRLSASSVNISHEKKRNGRESSGGSDRSHSHSDADKPDKESRSTIMGRTVDDETRADGLRAHEEPNATEKQQSSATLDPVTKQKTPVKPDRAAVGPAVGAAVSEHDVYPTDLRVHPKAPHLTVIECNQNGVTFSFDSIHLEHKGFRVSMPIMCAFSGDSQRDKLVARPFAFIDQSAAAIRRASDLEDKHTTHLLAGQSPSDLLTIMGTLSSLPKPFKFPLPYYVAPEHTNESIKCTTKRIGEDDVSCFVTIPDGKVALQWLLHVNGTCGTEYALLQRDVALLENVAWGALGDECRQRLNVWCPFETGERFQHYISDADFGKKDRGLAGLVITNNRLIYCKYHHRGSVPLDEAGTIRIKADDSFAFLTYHSQALGKTKLVTLHSYEVDELTDALAGFTEVTIEKK